MVVDRTIRLGQTLAPFGVGSLIVKEAESFAAMDINRWRDFRGRGRQIECVRLSEHLGINNFYEPRNKPSFSWGTAGAIGFIPYYRFPRAMFCPICRRLIIWNNAKERDLGDNKPSCASCGFKHRLIPMRFIQICSNGHMADVDWRYWAHWQASDSNQKQCQSMDLRFLTAIGRGGGLESLAVQCHDCKSYRTMRGIGSVDSLKRMGVGCTGTQPWENRRADCEETPHVVGATAANVYFPHVESALDIPPHSDFKQYGDVSSEIRSADHYGIVLDMYKSSTVNMPPMFEKLCLAITRSKDCEYEDVIRTLKEDSGQAVGSTVKNGDDKSLLISEWEALRIRSDVQDSRDRFQTSHVDITGTGLSGIFNDVVKVTRLREVRCLLGFNRYERTGDMDKLVPVDLTGQLDWRPATEVYGEGIFLSLSSEKLNKWENTANVIKRFQILGDRLSASNRSSWLPDGGPRFVALHSLSHMLLRELCFESGYSSASLRERIYCSNENDSVNMAGILIYTASGDSEGSMGGLVRQATPENLNRMLINAFDRSGWCSNDPVCREINGQGIDALNLAACHACALVAETSCIYANCLLDRLALVGDIGLLNGIVG